MKIELTNGLVGIIFQVEENKVLLKTLKFGEQDFLDSEKGVVNSYVHLSGGDYRGHFFGGYAKVSEIFNYVSHEIVDNGTSKKLVILEENDKLSVKTSYLIRQGLASIEVEKQITNVSEIEQVVESAMPICLDGIMNGKKSAVGNMQVIADVECASPLSLDDENTSENTPPKLWKAFNAWCGECCFEKIDTEKEGLRKFYKRHKSSTLSVTSNGSPSTYRYLPLGILEKDPYGYLMFEIFSQGSWSYSFQHATSSETLALCFGKNLYENGWFKILQPNESFNTERVRLVGADSMDGILSEITAVRRKALRKSGYQPFDYVIYNNFMQNTYDHPTEELDEINIAQAKKFGADYFVIDAGWHDDNLDMISPTQKIGEWKENVLSYPSGLNKTLEKIRKSGMKVGLWVEVQSIGIFCKNKDLLPDECFFNVRGKRVVGNRRYHLNFAVEKSREFATNIIDSMVERFSPDYIKIDYNQVQYGTETQNGSLTEGLSEHTLAYLKWFEEIQTKYPQILFESCASGGMNMSPTIAEKTAVFSLSDLSKFDMYPYMIANAPLVALPEQCGVWNMPVHRIANGKIIPNSELKTDDEEVIMNVINSLYMVMHLASKLEYLTEKQSKLLNEGIEYYKKLAPIKKEAVSIMPSGFSQFGEEVVYSAIKHGRKIYLSVYNLSDRDMRIAKNFSDYKISKAKLAYPAGAGNDCRVWNGVFQCELKAGTARAFELE